MRPRLKVVFSWVLAAIGFVVGLCALAKFGMWRAPLADHDQGWLLRWLTFVGIGLLAYWESAFWSAPSLLRETLGAPE